MWRKAGWPCTRKSLFGVYVLFAIVLDCTLFGTAIASQMIAKGVRISHRQISKSIAAETHWAIGIRIRHIRGELQSLMTSTVESGHTTCEVRRKSLVNSVSLRFVSCNALQEALSSSVPDAQVHLLRGAGWPCSDRFAMKQSRDVAQGFIILQGPEMMSIALSGGMICFGLELQIDQTLNSAHVYSTHTNSSERHGLPGGHCNMNIENSSSVPDQSHPQPNYFPQLSFLELKQEAIMSMLPGMKEILNPVVDGVMQPVVNVVANQLGPELNAPLCEDLAHGINEELPGDVAAMLEQTLTANLTNMLTDSITMLLSDSLTESLTEALGPYLDESITEAAQPRLHTAMHNILSTTIPSRLNRDIPGLLIRSLKIGLTQTLTRSVTHSVVPALSTALAHTNKQDIYCWMCYNYHAYCRLCHYSPQSSYYNQYYSGYYSDYCKLNVEIPHFVL